MADPFDPYREALVMETETVWSSEYDDWESATQQRVAEQLHADPEQAADLTYLRTHTGFCRQITVTAEDLERLGAG